MKEELKALMDAPTTPSSGLFPAGWWYSAMWWEDLQLEWSPQRNITDVYNGWCELYPLPTSRRHGKLQREEQAMDFVREVGPALPEQELVQVLSYLCMELQAMPGISMRMVKPLLMLPQVSSSTVRLIISQVVQVERGLNAMDWGVMQIPPKELVKKVAPFPDVHQKLFIVS